jgi:(+)-trans-carveol dehydrogenase
LTERKGRLDGKVALISGAARGQGRSHAVRLAEEGADVVAFDICEQVPTVSYSLATSADLDETAALVEKEGQRVLTRIVDVRDPGGLTELVDEATTVFESIDIVVANAGVAQDPRRVWEMSESQWQDVLDIDLTGVWHTVRAVVPGMIERDRGGSIVFTSSSAAVKTRANMGAYGSAKSALTGLMKALAQELAPYSIRVNTVNPGAVGTDMFLSDRIFRLFRPDLERATLDDAKAEFYKLNALPIPWIDPIDVSNAILWLATDEARYVTGIVLPVDAGASII